MEITGAPNTYESQVVQEVSVRGAEGDLYFVGGWAKGESVPEVGNERKGTVKSYAQIRQRHL